MDPYENLANAIILQAVDDFRHTEFEPDLQEIEEFFHSELFSVITDIDPDYLISRLRKEKRHHDS